MNRNDPSQSLLEEKTKSANIVSAMIDTENANNVSINKSGFNLRKIYAAPQINNKLISTAKPSSLSLNITAAAVAA